MDVVEFLPIDIEQTNWSTSSSVLSQLRHKVFVEEQNVAAAEEFDTLDNDAVHWLAYGQGADPIGCARLVGDKIGRMAVLKSHRRKGIGSALVRRIIRYAANNGMQSLQLNAQTHAIKFYESMLFKAHGDEFMDAGIPHRHMTLSLNRFISPKVETPLPDFSDSDRGRRLLDDAQAFNREARALAKRAHREIRIFSKNLDPKIYDNDEFAQLLLELGRSHPYAEINILVKNPHLLVQNGHKLLHLYHHLPSRIQMRSLNDSIKTLHTEFMLVDQAGILYNQSNDRYAGYAVNHAPREALDLTGNFDDMWEHSEPDPELRSLPI